MTRLIGFRCTHSNVFSREVLICPVSCAEPWRRAKKRPHLDFLQRFTAKKISACVTTLEVFAIKTYFAYSCGYEPNVGERAYKAGDLSEGPYPFSFRTRQSSLLEPMVLLRGESRLSPALWTCFTYDSKTLA